jgi:hypothetical protein
MFSHSQINKGLGKIGKLKAKLEMALTGGERISVGKAKAIAARAAGDPTMAGRTTVTHVGRVEAGPMSGVQKAQNPGSHYNPSTDTIQTSPRAAVAAHEGTHAAQARMIKDLAKRAGLPEEAVEHSATAVFAGANAASAAAAKLAGSNVGTGKRVAGTVLGHLPQLGLEGHATLRGTLTQPGGLRAAAGSFGSYAGAAGNNIRRALRPRELSARDELQEIIQFDQDGLAGVRRVQSYMASPMYGAAGGAMSGLLLGGSKRAAAIGAGVGAIGTTAARYALGDRINALEEQGRKHSAQALGAAPAMAAGAAGLGILFKGGSMLRGARRAGAASRRAANSTKDFVNETMARATKGRVEVVDHLPEGIKQAQGIPNRLRLMSARDELHSIIELGYTSDFLSSAATSAGAVAGVGGAYLTHQEIMARGGYGAVRRKAVKATKDFTKGAYGRARDKAAQIASSRKVRIGAGVGAALAGAGALYSMAKKKDDRFEMSAREELIELAGGYINTEEGVRKEKGIGAHFNRASGRYIGTVLGGPIGLPIGYLIDRSRADHNIIRSKYEEKQPHLLAKGKVRMSAADELDLIQLGLRQDINTYKALTLKPAGRMGPLKLVNDMTTKSTLAAKKGMKLEDFFEKARKSRALFNMSAREQLDTILFGYIGARDVGKLTGPGAALLGAGVIGGPIVAGVAGHHMGKKEGEKKERLRQYARELIARGYIKPQQLSAADELNTILFGTDPRPRDQQGQFTDANGNMIDPNSIAVAYQKPMQTQPQQQAEPEEEQSAVKKLMAKLKR